MNHSYPAKKILITFILFLFIASLCSCSDAKKTKSSIKSITSANQLNKITRKAKNRLLIIDLYNATCMPCYFIFPALEEIAREYKGKVTIYKIDIDKNPEIAKTFGVTRRPFVVFIKNQKKLHSIAGLEPKDTYVRAIEQLNKGLRPEASSSILLRPVQQKSKKP